MEVGGKFIGSKSEKLNNAAGPDDFSTHSNNIFGWTFSIQQTSHRLNFRIPHVGTWY